MDFEKRQLFKIHLNSLVGRHDLGLAHFLSVTLSFHIPFGSNFCICLMMETFSSHDNAASACLRSVFERRISEMSG